MSKLPMVDVPREFAEIAVIHLQHIQKQINDGHITRLDPVMLRTNIRACDPVTGGDEVRRDLLFILQGRMPPDDDPVRWCKRMGFYRGMDEGRRSIMVGPSTEAE